jgi:predicted nucleotidyltransferase
MAAIFKAPVAKLDRAPDFESCRAYHKMKKNGMIHCDHPLFCCLNTASLLNMKNKVVALMTNPKDTSKDIEELAKRIVPILRGGGVVEASVFGSFTRGEVQPDSDLDLLVKYKETVSLLDVSGLKCELEKLLGNIATHNLIQTPFLDDFR